MCQGGCIPSQTSRGARGIRIGCLYSSRSERVKKLIFERLPKSNILGCFPRTEALLPRTSAIAMDPQDASTEAVPRVMLPDRSRVDPHVETVPDTFSVPTILSPCPHPLPLSQRERGHWSCPLPNGWRTLVVPLSRMEGGDWLCPSPGGRRPVGGARSLISCAWGRISCGRVSGGGTRRGPQRRIGCSKAFPRSELGGAGQSVNICSLPKPG